MPIRSVPIAATFRALTRVREKFDIIRLTPKALVLD